MTHHDFDYDIFTDQMTRLQPHRKVNGLSYGLPLAIFSFMVVGILALAALYPPALLWWGLGCMAAGFVACLQAGAYR